MSNTKNSEQFLATFNHLEKHFKKKYFKGSWKSFKQMLKEGSRANPIIRQFKEDLFEFADLRNAIVHNRNHNYQVIAEPHNYIVEQFNEISRKIITPKKVNTFFKKVHTCLLNDNLFNAIELINKYKISVIPIVNNQLQTINLLNTSTISYWLSNNDNCNLKETLVSEVLKYKEYENNYEFIKANTSVYHAAEIYRKSHLSEPKNKYFDALLITQNGIASEQLKGLIVLSDIAEYI